MSSPIHILHVVSNLEPAGLELTLARVAAGLPAPAFRHTICCLKGEPEIAAMFSPTVEIHCLHAKHHDPGIWRRLRDLVRQSRPDVVHARNWSCWPDAVKSRLAIRNAPPLLMSFHGYETAATLGWRRRMGMRMLARFTTGMFAISNAFHDMLIHNVGLPAKRLCVLPNGVDTDRFRPQSRQPHSRVVVGTAGWLHAVKNHRLLVDAARALVAEGLDVEVRIAGRGELRDELAAAVGPGLAGRVQLLGHVADMPAFLADLDIFVLPSDAEGLPNALLEAMAAGLPCVATRVGGSVEVLGGGQFGLLVPPRDAEALAWAIKSLATDAAKRRDMGSLARERAAHEYSLPRMVRRYDMLYRSLTAGKMPAPQVLEGVQ